MCDCAQLCAIVCNCVQLCAFVCVQGSQESVNTMYSYFSDWHHVATAFLGHGQIPLKVPNVEFDASVDSEFDIRISIARIDKVDLRFLTLIH